MWKMPLFADGTNQHFQGRKYIYTTRVEKKRQIDTLQNEKVSQFLTSSLALLTLHIV